MSTAIEFAKQLIGQKNSRTKIPTPALILDEYALVENIQKMAHRVRGKVNLRPHAKTHKSAWISQLQIDAGAVGVCCTKLGEAEALSREGVRNILLTAPVTGRFAAERVAGLVEADPGFVCVVDHPAILADLAQYLRARSVTLNFLIDVDVGLTRSGVTSAKMALTLAASIKEFSDCLKLVGVQGYGGHWQHIPNYDERRRLIVEGMTGLQDTVHQLQTAGHNISIVTGGGTGTVEADLELGVLNELQPGSYIFMDMQYREALGQDRDGAFSESLFVCSSVVGTNVDHIVTLDAGLKAFSSEGPSPSAVGREYEGTSYLYFGDEHGLLTRPASPLALGDRVELNVPHCDPTVDRYDFYHVVRGDVLASIIPINAARLSN